MTKNCTARNDNVLQRVHTEMAQDAARAGTVPGATGVSGRCDYDLDPE